MVRQAENTTTTYRIRADGSNYIEVQEIMAQKTENFGRRTKGVWKDIATGAGVASALVTAHFARMVSENLRELRTFEDQLATINKLADVTESIDATREQIRKLSLESGRGLNEIAVAYENIYSVGLGPQANSVAVAADRLAKSIDVDLGTATRLITANMNAFGIEAENVDRIMDVMSGTIDVAAFSGEAYARVMGRMVGTAEATGVSMESMNAVWATLTTSGMEAGEAASGFSQLVLQLARETTEAGKIFKEATNETFVEFMERTGGDLPAALRVLKDHMEETGLTTTRVFGAEVRAITAFSLLSTTQGVNNLTSAVDDLNDSLGLTEENALLAEQSLAHLHRLEETRTDRLMDDFLMDLDENVIRPGKGFAATGLEATGATGTVAWMLAGAAAGSFLPGVGTLAGAGVGAGVGLLGSILGGNLQAALNEADVEAEELWETLTSIQRILFEPEKVEILDIEIGLLTLRYLNQLAEEYDNLEDPQERVNKRLEVNRILEEAGVASKEELLTVLGKLIDAERLSAEELEGYGAEIKQVTQHTKGLYEWNEELHRSWLRTIDGGTKYKDTTEQVNQAMVDQLELFDEIVGNERTNWDALLNDQAALTKEWLDAYDAANKYLGVQDAILFNEVVSWENAERLALMRAPEIRNWTEDDRNAYIGEVLDEMRTGNRQEAPAAQASRTRGTGTPATVRPRVTPSEILTWSKELARYWVTEKGQTDISWKAIQPLIQSRIADDQRIRDQFGFERYGMSEARVSDFSQGAWRFSGAADVFRAAVDDFWANNQTYEQMMTDYIKQLKEDSEQFHKELMDSVYGGNETNRQWWDRRVGIVNDKGDVITAEAERLFGLARGAMDDDALSRLDVKDFFERATFATGFFGGRGMEGHTLRTFQRMWDEWFKVYRDNAIIGEMFGGGSDNLRGFLGTAGFGQFGRSSAALSFGDLGKYVRDMECDFAKATDDQTAVLRRIEYNTAPGNLSNNFYGVYDPDKIANEIAMNAKMRRL